MQLDETNEQFLMSTDVTSILTDLTSSSNTIFSSLVPRTQPTQTPCSMSRRYNIRRNSDFPCSSTHASRSSEFLQVPTSSSQQRLNQSTLNKLSRIRDIREASMDQIRFRIIDSPTEPIINISSVEDSSQVNRPTKLDIQETTPPSTTLPLLREIKTYTRSKTTPLAALSGAQYYSTPKRCEARDLCGSSSTEDSSSTTTTTTATTTGHQTTFV